MDFVDPGTDVGDGNAVAATLSYSTCHTDTQTHTIHLNQHTQLDHGLKIVNLIVKQ